MTYPLTTQRASTRGLWLRLLVLVLAITLFTSALVPAPAQTEAQGDALFDLDWYRATLIDTVDLWNGGLNGTTGMGAYLDDFNGLFHVGLSRDWKPQPMSGLSSVAQSRAIYMNVEAYRAAGPEEGARFLTVAMQGADALIAYFKDTEYGGYYWQVDLDGRVMDSMKQGYGNVHPIFALAQVYSISGEQRYLDEALEQVDLIVADFADPDYPGGLRPNFNREFTEIIGYNNVDSFTHWFEALLALYDVTEGDQQAAIADMITLHGNFLTQTLYHDQDGFTDRGYVAYNYDDEWQPAQLPYSRETQWSTARHATTGHNIELAYLLSRAVERGFDPDWLAVADKLIAFCLAYAIDPTTGGMLYELTDYDGSVIKEDPDNAQYVWWPQAETARAFAHFMVVREVDYLDEYQAIASLIHEHLTDQRYGGWYYGVYATPDLRPTGTGKGDIWKVAYHYSMYFAEILRLGEQYPERVAELNAAGS